MNNSIEEIGRRMCIRESGFHRHPKIWVTRIEVQLYEPAIRAQLTRRSLSLSLSTSFHPKLFPFLFIFIPNNVTYLPKNGQKR